MDERAEERRELAELERDDRDDAREHEAARLEGLSWFEQVGTEQVAPGRMR